MIIIILKINMKRKKKQVKNLRVSKKKKIRKKKAHWMTHIL